MTAAFVDEVKGNLLDDEWEEYIERLILRWNIPPIDQVEEAECGQCETVKTSTEFHSASRVYDGLYPWCRECTAEAIDTRVELPAPLYNCEQELSPVGMFNDPSVREWYDGLPGPSTNEKA